jgi:hypothetical protein
LLEFGVFGFSRLSSCSMRLVIFATVSSNCKTRCSRDSTCLRTGSDVASRVDLLKGQSNGMSEGKSWAK